MNIGSGGSYTFTDPRPELCTEEIFLSITVHSDLEPNNQLMNYIARDPNLPPNGCLNSITVSLGQKAAVASDGQPEVGKLRESLEFIVM
jgi:hypothetical protein